MRFAQLSNELFCKPCLLTPQLHQQISRIFMGHVTGDAHKQGGCIDMFAMNEGNGRGKSKGVMEVVEDVAIIQVSGIITKRMDSFMKSCCGMHDIDDIEQALREAEENPRVRGIFLYVDSPGGSVTGTPECGKMVAETTKPVVAFTDTMMASAGYWIPSGADVIVATPSSEVGSIGVYMAVLDASRAYEMAGYDQLLFKDGKYKGAGYPGTELTPEQSEHFQAEVMEISDWFKGAVTTHRIGVEAETMQGQTFGGNEAMRRGLIDEVGDYDFAMNELRTLIEMNG